MKAPAKDRLLKALERIGDLANDILDVATDTVPRVGPELRPEQRVELMANTLRDIRNTARAARGYARWGRRPSLEPLPPEDEQ